MAGASLRVHVDPGKCQGHNRCKALAPPLFLLDDFGHAHPAGTGAVPADLAEQGRLAVANCPEGAVTLTSEDSP